MDSGALVFAILHEVDSTRVDEVQLRASLELATAAHLSQTRIGRDGYPVDPYIVHPLRNVLRLIRLGCADTDVLSATALHDTVEDQPEQIVSILSGVETTNTDVALRLIAEHFSDETARLVASVTNTPTDSTLSRSERNDAYAGHVETVISDPKVFLVKYADFVDNAGSVQYLDDDAKREKLSKKYAPLVPIFSSALESLDGRVDLDKDGVDAIRARLVALSESLGEAH
ncbi:hypothetical protein GCM10007304_11620 [Rhodococcoides trifolii]|uniref:HD domain-containing protein n=2 Tax=Rhodococcoides trifolii TaxID=908250 RepID=A0A917CWQ7_9NOCA|nr:hypothetical protein GCM10007304_11620 [Rhodococcus trifolii]